MLVPLLGFRVEGAGFRVQGLGLRVEGLGHQAQLSMGKADQPCHAKPTTLMPQYQYMYCCVVLAGMLHPGQGKAALGTNPSKPSTGGAPGLAGIAGLAEQASCAFCIYCEYSIEIDGFSGTQKSPNPLTH